uniref:VapC toxin protein n=1 Tax=uncultured Thiotrichaceae bacterium TaxID=298394 RepID=A0A6S6T3X3_9GAMM|nr:MAG: VapC toxin protein [uncultured Thiotrichaceae bacterium]
MGLKYLLDTNIWSEAVKPEPNPNVMAQLKQCSGEYCISVTVWHELNYGVARMAESKRKQSFQSYIDALNNSGLSVVPYDKAAGEWLAKERGRLSQQGIAVSPTDGEIAAVAAVNKLIVVTRNVKDFVGFDELVIENWFIKL